MARPKRIFTDEDKALIANYALDGGKNNTIASAMGIPVNTLTNRFMGLLKEYRAYRKLKLARNQTRLSKTSADMAKFLGVNELGQEIKQTVKTEPIKQAMTEAEQKASEAAAKIYKLRLAE